MHYVVIAYESEDSARMLATSANNLLVENENRDLFIDGTFVGINLHGAELIGNFPNLGEFKTAVDNL